MFLGIWFIILAALTTLSIAYGLCYHGYHMVRMWEKPVAVGYMLILALVNQNVCHITFGKIVEEMHLSKFDFLYILLMTKITKFVLRDFKIIFITSVKF